MSKNRFIVETEMPVSELRSKLRVAGISVEVGTLAGSGHELLSLSADSMEGGRNAAGTPITPERRDELLEAGRCSSK